LTRAKTEWTWTLNLVLILGMIPLLLYAASQSNPWTVVAGGAFVAVASAMAGAFLGFIFGLPRAAPSAATAAGVPPSPLVRPNTNLQQFAAGFVGVRDLAASHSENADASRGERMPEGHPPSVWDVAIGRSFDQKDGVAMYAAPPEA
jgi:hypothetical protein